MFIKPLSFSVKFKHQQNKNKMACWNPRVWKNVLSTGVRIQRYHDLSKAGVLNSSINKNTAEFKVLVSRCFLNANSFFILPLFFLRHFFCCNNHLIMKDALLNYYYYYYLSIFIQVIHFNKINRCYQYVTSNNVAM